MERARNIIKVVEALPPMECNMFSHSHNRGIEMTTVELQIKNKKGEWKVIAGARYTVDGKEYVSVDEALEDAREERDHQLRFDKEENAQRDYRIVTSKEEA